MLRLFLTRLVGFVMANVISCPSCDRQLRVPDELLGQSVKCPSCNETFTAALSPDASAGGSVSSSPAAAPRRDREDNEDAPPRRRPIRRDDADDSDGGAERPGWKTPLRGDTIQILGILAFIPFLGMPFILGPIAWIMGNGAHGSGNGRRTHGPKRPKGYGRQAAFVAKIALLTYGGVLLRHDAPSSAYFTAVFAVALSAVPA